MRDLLTLYSLTPLCLLSVTFFPCSLASLCPSFSFGLTYFLVLSSLLSLFLICLVPLLLCYNFGLRIVLFCSGCPAEMPQVGRPETAAVYSWALKTQKCKSMWLRLWPLMRPSRCPTVVKREATCSLFGAVLMSTNPAHEGPPHSFMAVEMPCLLPWLCWSLVHCP